MAMKTPKNAFKYASDVCEPNIIFHTNKAQKRFRILKKTFNMSHTSHPVTECACVVHVEMLVTHKAEVLFIYVTQT